jgi:hypothetical protein
VWEIQADFEQKVEEHFNKMIDEAIAAEPMSAKTEGVAQ